MRSLAGRPLLWHTMQRLKEVGEAARLVLITTERPEDRELCDLASSEGVPFFQGSTNDVLDRFYKAIQVFSGEVVVRATGDNPLVDPVAVERTIRCLKESGADYAHTLTELGSPLPVGAGVDAFSFKCLERCWQEAKKPDHREHINEYIKDNATQFRIVQPEIEPRLHCPDLRVTVDTEADLQKMEQWYRQFYKPGMIIDLAQVIGHVKGLRT